MSIMNRAPSLTAIISLVYALAGFSYNAWRLEQSEENNIVRDAAFQVLTELAEFEQVLYANHYDQNEVEGSPRVGWVKIGLVNDLAVLIGPQVSSSADELKSNWADIWVAVNRDRVVVDGLVLDIDEVRAGVKERLADLD